MQLVHLIYASQKSKQFGTHDIERVMASATRNNARNNITGALLFNSGMFLQCLEGGATAINALYRTLMSDSRHCDLRLIEYVAITERMFEQWSMAYLPDTFMTRSVLLKYSGVDHFDPLQMSGASVKQMLTEFSQRLARGDRPV